MICGVTEMTRRQPTKLLRDFNFRLGSAPFTQGAVVAAAAKGSVHDIWAS